MSPAGRMVWEDHREARPGQGCPRCRYLIKHTEAIADEIWCNNCQHFHREAECPQILPAESA